MTHIEKAWTFFSGGYNCAQSVAGAFATDVGLDENDILSLTSGLGGGIAGLRQTCGAELGAILILGKVFFDPKDPKSKNEVAQLSRKLVEKFQMRNDGNDQCACLMKRATLSDEAAALLGIENFPGMRPCAKYVRDCVELVESFLRVQ